MAKQRGLISFDWAIKRLLRSKANFGILEGFLSELLKEDIKILSLLESKSNKENLKQKSNQLDLKVVNDKKEIIIIEIQYEHEFACFQRMLFASSKVICEHLFAGESYSEVVKVVSVNILCFDLGHGTDYLYQGTTRFKGTNYNDELALSNDQRRMLKREKPSEIFSEYYLIKVNQFDDVVRNTLDEWIYFLKNEEIKPSFTGKGLREAKDKLSIMKLSELELEDYEIYNELLRRNTSLLKGHYTLGNIDGLEKGREEGIEIGREEGIEKTKLETARKMLEKAISLSLISEITGLTTDQIKQIK